MSPDHQQPRVVVLSHLCGTKVIGWCNMKTRFFFYFHFVKHWEYHCKTILPSINIFAQWHGNQFHVVINICLHIFASVSCLLIDTLPAKNMEYLESTMGTPVIDILICWKWQLLCVELWTKNAACNVQSNIHTKNFNTGSIFNTSPKIFHDLTGYLLSHCESNRILCVFNISLLASCKIYHQSPGNNLSSNVFLKKWYLVIGYAFKILLLSK